MKVVTFQIENQLKSYISSSESKVYHKKSRRKHHNRANNNLEHVGN